MEGYIDTDHMITIVHQIKMYLFSAKQRKSCNTHQYYSYIDAPNKNKRHHVCYIVQHIWQSWIALTSICDSDKWQWSLNCCHAPSGWDIQATGYTPDHQSHRNTLKMYVYRIILLLYYQVQHCFNASSCSYFSNDMSFLLDVLMAYPPWHWLGICPLPWPSESRSSVSTQMFSFFPLIFQNGNWNQLISRQGIQALTILHLC